MLQRYRNPGGDSGVTAFEIGRDSITVQFQSGIRYLYDYRHTGRANVEAMKKLARQGRGLSTFISTAVKARYAAKLPASHSRRSLP
jgi:hypothetical protein